MKRMMVTGLAALLTLSFVSTSWATRVIDSYCAQPGYDCLTVKKGQSWQSLFPDPTQRGIVMRLNRMNTPIWGGMRIVVPKNLSQASLLDVSPMPYQISGYGVPTIMVQLNKLAWGAYDPSGNLVRWGPVSGGKSWCPDVGSRCNTATGNFTVYGKQGAACKSKKFPIGRGGAPMPYCMFFHGGFALHGSTTVPGYNASHGCVRIFTDDAKWLNQHFVQLDAPTRVMVRN